MLALYMYVYSMLSTSVGGFMVQPIRWSSSYLGKGSIKSSSRNIRQRDYSVSLVTHPFSPLWSKLATAALSSKVQKHQYESNVPTSSFPSSSSKSHPSKSYWNEIGQRIGEVFYKQQSPLPEHVLDGYTAELQSNNNCISMIDMSKILYGLRIYNPQSAGISRFIGALCETNWNFRKKFSGM